MPHVQVQLYEGRTPEVKSDLAKRISKAFEDAGVCESHHVSVLFSDVRKIDWITWESTDQAVDPEGNV